MYVLYKIETPRNSKNKKKQNYRESEWVRVCVSIILIYMKWNEN